LPTRFILTGGIASSGHLLQGRYKSFLVQEGDYLLGFSRYVHLNPVRGVRFGEAFLSSG
jgi:hypothetical protein